MLVQLQEGGVSLTIQHQSGKLDTAIRYTVTLELPAQLRETLTCPHMFRPPGSGARFNDNMWHTVLVTRETARVSADLGVLLTIATANKFEYRVKKNKVVLTIF